MPTVHIKAEIFQKVTRKTMEAIRLTKRPVKESEVLNTLVLKGLETISDEELERLGKK